MKATVLDDAQIADDSRIARVLRVVVLLQAQQGCNVLQLSRSLGVSERTIFRDLRSLASAGLRPKYDRRARVYRLDRPLYLPLDLAVDEAMALVLLVERIAGREQVPFLSAARRAVAKMTAALPESLRRDITEADQHIDIALAASSPPQESPDAYEQVRQAILSRTALRCAYQSPKSGEEVESFTFLPYALFFSQRAWYTVGWHSGRNNLRSLKLVRFVAIASTTDHYEIPDRFSLKRDVIGNAWRMIRGDRTFDVEIRFDAAFADGIEEVHWHDTQEIEHLADGSIRFRCRVDGLDEILWWVLSMGSHCRVIQPAELADRIKHESRKVAALYEMPRQKKRPSASKMR